MSINQEDAFNCEGDQLFLTHVDEHDKYIQKFMKEI